MHTLRREECFQPAFRTFDEVTFQLVLKFWYCGLVNRQSLWGWA